MYKFNAISHNQKVSLNIKKIPSTYYLIIHPYSIYVVSNAADCVTIIIKEYHKIDLSMYDLLATIKVIGFSIEVVANIYAECMKISDGDTIIHIREDIDLTELEDHCILGL